MSARKTCTVDGCELTVVARGLCRRHYLQEWRAGTIAEHSTRRPHVCPASHPHDHSCYLEHVCRCGSCRREQKNWRQRHAARMKAYGRDHRISPPRVDAGPAREHLRALLDAGCGLERVSEASGVGRGVLADLAYGRRGKARKQRSAMTIRADHAARLLSTTVGDVERGLVNATGTRRRLQALVTIGWTQTELAHRLGVLVTNLNKTITGRHPVVLASTAHNVADLYDRLSMTPKTGTWANHARKIAAEHGWMPPLAWDDIDNDPSPPVAPDSGADDELAISYACEGLPVKLTLTERRAAVARLHTKRLSDKQIADRLGITSQTVLRIRDELKLPGWTKSEQADGRAAA